MSATQDVVVVLPEEEAWEVLARQQLGRLAYHLLGEVHIVPVNHAVSEGRLLFRTAPGSKLLGVVMNEDVAFEVDEVRGDRATSVVVRGRAALLRGRDADRAADLLLPSWLPTDKSEVVSVAVHEITGRRFRLDPH